MEYGRGTVEWESRVTDSCHTSRSRCEENAYSHRKTNPLNPPKHRHHNPPSHHVLHRTRLLHRPRFHPCHSACADDTRLNGKTSRSNDLKRQVNFFLPPY